MATPKQPDTRNIHKLYQFQESRFTSLTHELRVYIYGADVTPWLKGDLSITYGNRDGFNTCSFELANPRKLWQLTRDNLNGIWRESVGEYSEGEKLVIYRWKNNEHINPSFNLDINTVILGQRATTVEATQPGPLKLRPTEEGTERRYRLAVNDCIFSRQDPMRIFMRNPFGTTDPLNEWVEIFCGFVHDHPITTNYQTGESTVRISGYCIRQLLTKMRVQMNRLTLASDVGPIFSRSFFSDYVSSEVSKNPFSGTTLEDTIKKLILGSATLAPGETALVTNGIGAFKMGNVVCYDPAAPLNTLERWHLMTIFGVNKLPFPTGADDDLWLTTAEMVNIGRITIDLPDTYGQGPGGRYLHFLLPVGGTGAGALVQSTIDESPMRQVEWTTRWEIIREFASKLDFQVTTSPSGDILVEFPMYGFTPHVFTNTGGIVPPVPPPTFAQQQAAQASAKSVAAAAVQPPTPTNSSSNAQFQEDLAAYDAQQKAIVNDYLFSYPAAASAAQQANAKSVASVVNQIDQGAIPTGLAALLTFQLHQIEDTLNDEAEDFPTIIQVDGGNAVEPLNVAQSGTAPLTNIRAYVYSPVLVSRFGVIAEQMSIPFAGQRGGDIAGATDSPIAKRIGKLALIEYMKRLADSSTWDGSVVYRPFLFPNRPVWLMRSSRMGILTSVTQRWTIGKSAATTLSLNMLMFERYNPSNPSPQTEYRLPTGAANTPIDYANIWKDSAQGQSNSGVISVVGTKDPPSSAANGGAGAVGSGTAVPVTASTAPDVVVPFRDPTYMYKPFSDAIAAALSAAEAQGMKVTITATFRDPKKQEAMKAHPDVYGVAKDKNGRFVQVAEPWKSCHQYGMAVDIKIASGKRSDYKKFAALAGDSIHWGGNYGDYVHYEWSTQPPGKTGIQCQKIVNAEKLKDTPAPVYLQKIWAQFDALRTNPTLSTAGQSIVATPESKRPMEILGIGESKVTGTSEAATAEPCTPALLTESGVTSFTTS